MQERIPRHVENSFHSERPKGIPCLIYIHKPLTYRVTSQSSTNELTPSGHGQQLKGAQPRHNTTKRRDICE